MAAMMSGFMRLRHSSTASSSLRASSLWSFFCDPNSQVQQCFRLFSSGSESEPTPVEPLHRISHTDVSTLDDVLAPVTVVEVPVATSAAADHLASPDESVLEIQEVLDTPAKPRVAPLPEDLSPEALEAQSHVAEAVKEKLKPSIPLPSFWRNQQRITRSDPLLLADAIRQVKENAKAKFDETVEAHVRLGIDPRRGDQMVRGAATLPHGSGKVVRVAVFAEGAEAQEAIAAGADVVGADDLIDSIKESGGKLDFDKCIATPSFMPRLGKVARILGPRGLMPNPKVGTVTNNVGEAVKAAKQGRVDFRADKGGIVHVGLGKVSFTEAALQENVSAFVGAVLGAKPVGLKKSSRYAGYFNSFTLSSTMGKGVPVTIQSLAQAADSYAKSAGNTQ